MRERLYVLPCLLSSWSRVAASRQRTRRFQPTRCGRHKAYRLHLPSHGLPTAKATGTETRTVTSTSAPTKTKEATKTPTRTKRPTGTKQPTRTPTHRPPPRRRRLPPTPTPTLPPTVTPQPTTPEPTPTLLPPSPIPAPPTSATSAPVAPQPPAAPPSGTNLLTNSGFEEGSAGWGNILGGSVHLFSVSDYAQFIHSGEKAVLARAYQTTCAASPLVSPIV